MALFSHQWYRVSVCVYRVSFCKRINTYYSDWCQRGVSSSRFNIITHYALRIYICISFFFSAPFISLGCVQSEKEYIWEREKTSTDYSHRLSVFALCRYWIWMSRRRRVSIWHIRKMHVIFSTQKRKGQKDCCVEHTYLRFDVAATPESNFTGTFAVSFCEILMS